MMYELNSHASWLIQNKTQKVIAVKI